MIKNADELTVERGDLDLLVESVTDKTRRAIPADASTTNVKMAALKALGEELGGVGLEDVLELKAMVEIGDVDTFDAAVEETLAAGLNAVASWGDKRPASTTGAISERAA
jgi:hypothetical protein